MTIVKDKDFYKQLFRLTFPIILQQLLRISVNTIDSIMIGSIDQVQMSAISQANQVFFILYTMCSGLSVGCCVLVAQYWGKRDRESISTIIAHGIRAITLLGVVVSFIVMSFPEAFMRIYASDAEIIALGANYLRKVALMYTACGISVMLFGASRGVEQVRIILFTNIISYSVNIFLDYALIFGAFSLPKMGLDGVALGTIIARYVELIVCGAFFLKDENVPFTFKDIKRSDPSLRKDFLKVSAPIVAHEIVWSLGTSSCSMITGQLGKSVVAGYNVETVFYDLCASVGNGFNSACSVVIGTTLGRGEKEKAKEEAKTMLLMALVVGIGLGMVTFFGKEAFLSLYSLDAAARTYALQFMNVISCIWPFSMLEMIGMIAILRAGGEGHIGFYTDIVVMWCISIPLAAYCAFSLHTEPWIVVAIIKNIIVLEALVGVARVLSFKWIKDLTRN